ncbi:MAG TPA: hypothetical protein QF753_17375 [Victivallales bacterium]|nr:hypothetical protein [Victivallales bacterium]
MKNGKSIKKAMKMVWDSYCNVNTLYAESIIHRYPQIADKKDQIK